MALHEAAQPGRFQDAACVGVFLRQGVKQTLPELWASGGQIPHELVADSVKTEVFIEKIAPNDIPKDEDTVGFVTPPGLMV